MKYIISKSEKRFIRRELINYFICKRIKSIRFIIDQTRRYEAAEYSQEMNIYKRSK